MTTTSTPGSRPVVGLLFALAGLLATLSIIFVLVHVVVGGVWFGIITDAALTLAFLFLALGKGSGTIARLLFAVAAVGWAIVTINAFVPLGFVATIGVVLALAGSLISGILAVGGKVFSRLANIAFLIAGIFIGIVLLNQLVAFLTGTVAIIVVIIYAVSILVTGLLITARR